MQEQLTLFSLEEITPEIEDIPKVVATVWYYKPDVKRLPRVYSQEILWEVCAKEDAMNMLMSAATLGSYRPKKPKWMEDRRGIPYAIAESRYGGTFRVELTSTEYTEIYE